MMGQSKKYKMKPLAISDSWVCLIADNDFRTLYERMNKPIGIKYMTSFCDEDVIFVLKEPGFRSIGQYMLYTRETYRLKTLDLKEADYGKIAYNG